MEPTRFAFLNRLSPRGMVAGVAIVACLVWVWTGNSWHWQNLIGRRELDDSARSKERHQELMAQTRNIAPIALGDRVEHPHSEGWINPGKTTLSLEGKWTVLDVWALW